MYTRIRPTHLKPIGFTFGRSFILLIMLTLSLSFFSSGCGIDQDSHFICPDGTEVKRWESCPPVASPDEPKFLRTDTPEGTKPQGTPESSPADESPEKEQPSEEVQLIETYRFYS